MQGAHDVPLAVDLDGTLINTDTLHELLLKLIKSQPAQILWLPFVLLQCLIKGKQVLKIYLVERVQLNPELLPYNKEFLAYLKQQHQAGRSLLLVTGCHQKVASAISQYLGIFKQVIATDEHKNLTGRNKADVLVQQFGNEGFDYAGNSRVDVPVWRKARNKILVNASPGLSRSLKSQFKFGYTFDPRCFSIRLLIKGLRIHQWAKNALIFLPALTSHSLAQPNILLTLLMAFIAFGCCASFSYVINDLLDLDDDRKHHRKKYRPFASGAITIPAAVFLAAALLLLSITLAAQLNTRFIGLLALYFVATNLYSFQLKKVPILDVSVLAGLYTLRVLAGAFVISIQPSFWLIAFSAFLFFSLAIVKRLSELLYLKNQGVSDVKARGYIAEDISTLQGLGSASAIASVLVMALYINSDNVRPLYHSPDQLWLLCPVLLLWLGRVWLITGRGFMHDDPVVFALKDRMSWLILLLGACVLVSATFF